MPSEDERFETVRDALADDPFYPEAERILASIEADLAEARELLGSIFGETATPPQKLIAQPDGRITKPDGSPADPVPSGETVSIEHPTPPKETPDA